MLVITLVWLLIALRLVNPSEDRVTRQAVVRATC
jgi:hypothetical protein